jgi:C-terminal processing protease CtpA/Prc
MKKIILLFVLWINMLAFSIAQTKIQFVIENLPEHNSLKVGIRGNTAPLSWKESLPLVQKGNFYEIEIPFAETVEKVEYKFVLFNDDNSPTWEAIENRFFDIKHLKDTKIVGQWEVQPIVDFSNVPKLTLQQLIEDYRLIETMVLKVHPGAVRYRSEEELINELRTLKIAFQKPLTHGEAYLAMSKMTAFLQCDHTSVGFNNQNRWITSIIHEQKDKMPFTFRWIDGEMILVYNASENDQLKRGTKILTINNVKVDKIKNAMLPYIAADGGTDANRIRKMEVDGFDFRYNAFDVFYPLLYPFKEDNIRLDVIFPNEKNITEVNIKPITRGERSKILASRYADFPKTRDDLWKFEITNDKIGILTINSFGLMGWKKMNLDYKKFLADAFAEMKAQKVKSLVIDARWNTGGFDEMKHELFSYLKLDKAATIQREKRSRYSILPEELKPHIQTWGDTPWYYDLKPGQDKNAEGYYVFPQKDGNMVYPKRKTRFKGQVYLLSSSLNTSLAYYLASDFKLKKVGTIIGQETGGNLQGINGDQILFMTLPNSTIEIDFPIKGTFTVGNVDNQGVVPDIKVRPIYEDILNNVDAEMNAALKLIRK